MSDVLKIAGLSYRMNRKEILTDVDLEVTYGKIVALVGANGAGKTTLMRVIAGVAKNYQGTVTVAGESSEAGRKAHLSMTDNLSAFADGRRIREVKSFYEEVFVDFDGQQFDQLLEFMNLNAEDKLSSLSKGMREKLIIALAFARKTDLYLLDEPFSGVDAMSRKKIIKSLLLWKPDEATIIISDHVLDEIAPVLDEVVLLKDKHVLKHKSADEIREGHASIEEWYESFYEGEE